MKNQKKLIAILEPIYVLENEQITEPFQLYKFNDSQARFRFFSFGFPIEKIELRQFLQFRPHFQLRV